MEWVEIAKDLNAGTVGGVAGIITGHPLDTIKVRLQTQSAAIRSSMASGPVGCIKQIARSEGIRGFYKGMLSPIISNAPINAVVFAAYGQTSRVIQNISQSTTLSPSENFIAGSAAGFLQTVFASPAELVKITLQVDKKSKNTSSIQRARSMYQQHGLRVGLFRGWTWTALRDVPAFGIYFSSYDLTKTYLTDGLKENETDMNLLLAGGIAGTLSWMVLHPVDVIKSCLQSQKVENWKPASVIIQQHLAHEGPQFLLKGFEATMLRAFPVSAVTFLVYEKCMAFMSE